MNDKELCRKRIKVLQELKENLIDRINPLLSEESMDLYGPLKNEFNKIIDIEARNLS